MIRRIALTIAAAALVAAAAQIPRPAPDLTINLNAGKRLQLSAYKGKAVVLAFILTTCSHCQATTGLLSQLNAEYAPRGLQILESLNLRQRRLEIVSCPSCGRAQVDVYTLAEKVHAGLEGMTVPLRVAVMGCVVNGPGEAREADLGVASGNGKGQIFVRGEVIKTVPEAQIVETLVEEAMRIAEEMEAAGVSGEPSVSVS